MTAARAEGLALIALMFVMSFAFQIQLKLIADEVAPVLAMQTPDLWTKVKAVLVVVTTWKSFFTAILAGLLFLVWFLALMRLELSVALPLASVSVVITSLGSGLMLQEELTAGRIMGVLAVAAGIILILRS